MIEKQTECLGELYVKRTTIIPGKLLFFKQNSSAENAPEKAEKPGYQKLNFRSILKDQIVLVVLAVFFLLGLMGGSLFIRNADFSILEQLDFLFFSNFQGRISSQLTSVFIASFASSFFFLFLCFLCGLSMWGAFLIPAIPFFRGFGLGLTAGYLYAAYGGHGVLYQLALILPGALLCIAAILLAGREGILFSKRLSLRMNRGKENGAESAQTGKKLSVKMYLIHYIFFIGLALLSALVDVATTACFSELFSFL